MSENRLMARQELENWQLRSMRYEAVEERLVLSADPLPALVLHGSLVGAVQQENVAYDHAAVDLQNVPSPTPMLGTVNATTGVNYVHSNYHLTGAGQTVAVIDSGIAYDHYNLGRGYGANYRVVGGWDFAENDANPYDDAPAGFHGTHVAGIIGSDHTTNTGVAPDVDLVALRVFTDSGQGNFAWVESALQWVIANRNSFDNPITTVNMSLGVPSMNSTTIPNWTTLEDELRTLNSLGIFVSVSAGNDFAQFNAQGLSYPAVSQYVVPVASANDAGTAMSNFSQRDDRVLVAPGETITSTVPDALFSFNGVANDWASASGTSMASPYVAGASVLVRQAYWSIGVTNVNQQMIYDTLFSTADLIYDPITAASYHFIDVQAAVSSIMSGAGGGQTQPPPPTDTDATGNTSQTAAQLGALGNGSSFSGQISNSADKDFYRFTAATTGRITLTATPAAGLATQWQAVVGVTAQTQGNSINFDVVAGQAYVVGLTPASGTGNYSVVASLQTVVTDLGTVDFRQVDNVQINGERWYRFTTTRDGLLAIEARTASGAQLGIQLYNEAQQPIANVDLRSGFSRADACVTAGQVVLLKLTGNSGDTDLLFGNLLSSSGNQVQVYGSAGDDVFTLRSGSTTALTVNGIYYSFNAANFSRVTFNAGGGNDRLQFTGTSASETAELRVGSASLIGSGWRVDANQLEALQFTGNGGSDIAKIYAAASSPTMNLAGAATRTFSLASAGIEQLAAQFGVTELGTVDFRQIDNVEINGERWYRLTATRTGLLAVEARTASGAQLGIQLYNETQQPIANIDLRSGFSRADACVSAGQVVLLKITGTSSDTDLLIGNLLSSSGNQVQVFGSAGNDTFTLRGGATTALTINGIYYSFPTATHNQVIFHAGSGNDSLQFTGTSGYEWADVYVGTTHIYGAGFTYTINGVEQLQLISGGGNDAATLWDSAGDDLLTLSPTLARLQGSGFDHRLTGFSSVRANATAGGYDIANTAGVAGNANFSATGFDRLTGTYASLEHELDALDLLYQSFSNWH